MHLAESLRTILRSVSSIAVLLVTLMSPQSTLAQVSAPFVGTWSATWQTEKKSYDAEMTLTPTGGTWRTTTHNRNNACAGREVPIKVVAASETELQLVLQFSEVLTGCPNASVSLKSAPDGTVTGTRSKFELKLLKK